MFRGKGSLLVRTVSTVAKCSIRSFGIGESLLAILSSNSKSFYLPESGYEFYFFSSDLYLTDLTSVTSSLIDALTLVTIQGLESCFALRFDSFFNWRVLLTILLNLL